MSGIWKVSQIDSFDAYKLLNLHPEIRNQWKCSGNVVKILRKVGTMTDDPNGSEIALKL